MAVKWEQIIFVPFVMLLRFSVANNISIELVEDDPIVRDCIIDVLKQVKLSFNAPVVLVNTDNLLGEKLLQTEGYNYYSRDFTNRHDIYSPQSVFLVMTETIEEFRAALDDPITKRRMIPWNPSGKFIIYIKSFVSLEKISSLLFERNIFNSTVIAKILVNGEYSIFNFDSVLEACNKPSRRKLNCISACSKYKGMLASAITLPSFDHQDQNASFVLQHYENLMDDLPDDSKGINYKCTSYVDCLLALKNSKQKSFIFLTKSQYEFYKWEVSNRADEVFYALSEAVGTFLKTVYFFKGSPIQEPFSGHSSRMFSAGIDGKLFQDMLERQKIKSIYHSRNTETSFTQFELMENFQEPFIILILGYFVSIVIFICEIMFHKRKICRNYNCKKPFSKLHSIWRKHIDL